MAAGETKCHQGFMVTSTRSHTNAFITGDFLLHSETARHLYHHYAAKQPILDYHSHLPSADVAHDRRFQNLFDIWLEGDHYKWRAMRANGVPEELITGEAPPYDKFLAWARTVPFTLRNPLYHWTHLELKRYFGIDDLLDEQSAPRIWEQTSTTLGKSDLTAQGILRQFDVRIVCTTDDPCDDLRHHLAINSAKRGFRVYPTFRPDAALRVADAKAFNQWADRLQAASNVHIATFDDFLAALKQRHDFFHSAGGRLSDHGLPYCYAMPCSEAKASDIFARVRAGKPASHEDQEQFASYLMLFFGRLDAEKGWTKQLHLGALRQTNTRQVLKLGPDSGFDAIGDWPQAQRLCSYLDQLEQEAALPKVIVYNSNPADNYVFATAIGGFQGGAVASKIQFGSAWWFLDQKDGIEAQLNALSNTGLLSRFVGMVTDSRSFMSFPRHEYFRRILCNLLGEEMEAGELPRDEKLIGTMVENVCFENARRFLGLELPPTSEASDDKP